jgi:hypothetical protein
MSYACHVPAWQGENPSLAKVIASHMPLLLLLLPAWQGNEDDCLAHAAAAMPCV